MPFTGLSERLNSVLDTNCDQDEKVSFSVAADDVESATVASLNRIGFHRRKPRSFHRRITVAVGFALSSLILIIWSLSVTTLTCDSWCFLLRESRLATHNQTLGFGAILLISLPERSDRRDAISLITSTSDIVVTKMINGVKGDEIAEKAIPDGLIPSRKYLGSYRSHMDAMKYVVDNRIETALILEDDVDWDIYIKEQMTSLSKALRSKESDLTNSSISGSMSPYGNDWDLLHLGTVRSMPPPDHILKDKYQRYVDEYSPMPINLCGRASDWFCYDQIVEEARLAKGERVIFPTYDSLGLPALAVTYAGAQRLLYDQSWRGLHGSTDKSINSMMIKGELAGFTIVPPIFSMWKIGNSQDSDLAQTGRKTSSKDKNRTDGHAPGLLYSSRKALKALIPVTSRWTRLSIINKHRAI